MNMKIKLEETHALHHPCKVCEQASIPPDKQSEYINKKRFCSHFGSCLLWVMLTEISVDIAVDIAVDSRSIVGRWSVDGRSIVGR